MSEEDKKLYFISFCIEQYKTSHHKDGAEVADLFNRKGVSEYLANNYDVLHTQGASWLVKDIDDYLISKSTLISELKTYKLIDQMLFHTDKSLNALRFIQNNEIR